MKLALKDKQQFTFSGNSFAELMQRSMSECMRFPEYENAPRGHKIKEMTDVQLFLNDPTNNLFANPARGVNLKYLAGELIWYFSQDTSIEYIGRFSKFWDHIANDDGTLNSAYGNLIFGIENEFNITGWQWVVKSLQNDKDSRQAIMHFNRPMHQRFGIKDFPCTISAQFMIRNNALNMYCTMRSNDFTFGLTYDLPFFTLLQQQLYVTLLAVYPDLELGSYCHNAKSLHIYEKDFPIVEEMLQSTFVQMQTPRVKTPLVDYLGNPTFELMCVKEGQYNGDDELLNWLQDNAK